MEKYSMVSESLFTTIPQRYCGPPMSGNGGYVCGTCAAFAHAASETRSGPFSFEARYRIPVPVDCNVSLIQDQDRFSIQSSDARSLFVEGKFAAESAAKPPLLVSLETARYAASSSLEAKEHPFPDCYVCGPARKPGDGLRILPGPVPDHNAVAAGVWTVYPDARGADGKLMIPVVWAALDCPGYFAYHFSRAGSVDLAVLARMKCTIFQTETSAENLVVVGWLKRKKGPLIEVGTALLDGSMILAAADAAWMQPASWNQENTGRRNENVPAV